MRLDHEIEFRHLQPAGEKGFEFLPDARHGWVIERGVRKSQIATVAAAITHPELEW